MRFSSVQRLAPGDDDKVVTVRLPPTRGQVGRSVLIPPPILLRLDLYAPLSRRDASPILDLLPRIGLEKPYVHLTVLDKSWIVRVVHKLGPVGLYDGRIGEGEAGEESVADIVA
jgi:hypothetical protein